MIHIGTNTGPLRLYLRIAWFFNDAMFHDRFGPYWAGFNWLILKSSARSRKVLWFADHIAIIYTFIDRLPTRTYYFISTLLVLKALGHSCNSPWFWAAEYLLGLIIRET
jgi:hypothetical protein